MGLNVPNAIVIVPMTCTVIFGLVSGAFASSTEAAAPFNRNRIEYCLFRQQLQDTSKDVRFAISSAHAPTRDIQNFSGTCLRTVGVNLSVKLAAMPVLWRECVERCNMPIRLHLESEAYRTPIAETRADFQLSKGPRVLRSAKDRKFSVVTFLVEETPVSFEASVVRDESNRVILFVKCPQNTPVKWCSGFFSSSRVPGLSIQVSFDQHAISDWFIMMQEVSALLSSAADSNR